MQVEKTQIFQVDGKPYLVAEFSPELRKQFEILDEMRQRHFDLAISVDMATMAVQVKTAQLQQIIKMQEAAKAGESKAE